MNQDTTNILIVGLLRTCAKVFLSVIFLIPAAGFTQEQLDDTVVVGEGATPAPRPAPAPIPVPDPVTIEQPEIDLSPLIVTGEVAALKTPTPLIDVPQSVTVFSEARMDDQGISRLGQIVDYTPGVANSQGEAHRDAIIFRGQRSTADFFLDGVRDDVQYYRSLYNVERVEILRGPSALTFGRGGTGGILNRVSKTPVVGYDFNGFDVSLDTFGSSLFQIDSNISFGSDSYITGGKGGKQIISEDTGAFRFNGFWEHLEGHRDFYEGERYGVNPTMAFILGPDTRLDVSYEYNDFYEFIDRGIPVGDNGLPVEALAGTVFGDPDQNYSTFESHSIRATLSHDLSDQWSARVSTFYGDYDKVYQNYYAAGYNESTDVVTIDGYVDTTVRQNFAISGDLVGEFETGNLGHTVLIGAEYMNQSSDQNRFNTFFDQTSDDQEFFTATNFALVQGSGINTSGNITSNDFTADIADDTRVTVDTASVFIQDQIAVGDYLDLVLGARYDSFDIHVNNVVGGEVRTRRDEEVSPRLGLIVKPSEDLSVYGSYSETFIPRSGEQFANINGSNNALDPNTFSNLEVGVNYDIADDFSLRAALFEMEGSSPQVADSDPSTLDVIDTETTGFEAELTGFLTDRWFVSAGYTYLDSEQVNRAGPTGLRPRELPEHMFSIWNQYAVNDRLGLGLGLVYQDQSFANNSNSSIMPSYTRVDAAVFYKLSDSYRIQLNVENLFDTDYYPHSHSTHQISVGAPINAALTIRGEF
ncbi:MAG: TonB-dependent siderophore receptor [Verrucomicrobiota bacterium]|nr:TonB-dependent siderophore receptor [Verrucomicrobiota bacterium]